MRARRLGEKGWAAVTGLVLVVAGALEWYFRLSCQEAPFIRQMDVSQSKWVAIVIFILAVTLVLCAVALAGACYKEHRTGWVARVLCCTALALFFAGHALNIQGGGLIEAELTVPAQISLPQSFDGAELSLTTKDLSVTFPNQVRWHFSYSEDITFNGWHFHVQKRTGDDMIFQLKNQPGMTLIYISYMMVVSGVCLWTMGISSRLRMQRPQ